MKSVSVMVHIFAFCPKPFSKGFNRPSLAAKVHLNSTVVPRCFPKLVLCVVLPLAGWDDVNL